ncbi:MAG: hypothetical protein QM723_31860 [Myxococcaceae bacterium]
MTPSVPPPPAPPKSGNTMRSFMFGVLASGALFGFFCLFGAILGWSSLRKREADVRRGWNLVPVVVASADISENTVVTFDSDHPALGTGAVRDRVGGEAR